FLTLAAAPKDATSCWYRSLTTSGEACVSFASAAVVESDKGELSVVGFGSCTSPPPCPRSTSRAYIRPIWLTVLLHRGSRPLSSSALAGTKVSASSWEARPSVL